MTLAQRPVSDGVPASTVWEIPVCYRRSRDGKIQPEACTLLSTRSQTMKLEGCSSWVFANADARGYYRVGYTDDGLAALRAAMKRDELTPVEQTSLLNDLWALVWLNNRSVDSYLALASQLVEAGTSPAIETALVRVNLVADRFIDDEAPAGIRAMGQTDVVAACRSAGVGSRCRTNPTTGAISEPRFSIRSATPAGTRTSFARPGAWSISISRAPRRSIRALRKPHSTSPRSPAASISTNNISAA